MTSFSYALTSSNTKRFPNIFTVSTGRKFVIVTPSPKILPLLKCVATLPGKMPVSYADSKSDHDHPKLSVPLSW